MGVGPGAGAAAAPREPLRAMAAAPLSAPKLGQNASQALSAVVAVREGGSPGGPPGFTSDDMGDGAAKPAGHREAVAAFGNAAAVLRSGLAPDADAERDYKRNPLPAAGSDATTIRLARGDEPTLSVVAADPPGGDVAESARRRDPEFGFDDASAGSTVGRRRWVVCFAAAALAAVCQWVAGDAGPMGCVDDYDADRYHRMSVSSLTRVDHRLPAPATLALIGPSGAFESPTARQCAAKRLLVWNTICGRGSAFVFMVILDAQLRRISLHRRQSSKLLYMPLLLEGWAIAATVGDVTSAMILYFLHVQASAVAAMASAFGLMLRVTQHAVWFGYWTFFAAAVVGKCMRTFAQHRHSGGEFLPSRHQASPSDPPSSHAGSLLHRSTGPRGGAGLRAAVARASPGRGSEGGSPGAVDAAVDVAVGLLDTHGVHHHPRIGKEL